MGETMGRKTKVSNKCIYGTLNRSKPPLGGLEVTPQLMRSETIIFFMVDFTIYRIIKDIKKKG